MANRKPKVTHPSQRKLIDKIKGTGTKVKQYVIDSDRANTGEKNSHAMTDGRSSAGLQTQRNQYGGKGVATTSPNGRMAVEVKTGNTGKVKYDTKNATTNLFTDKDNGNQSGRRKLTAKQKAAGEKSWQGNRRQRDYYVRVGMNNDQRSPEAIARLRALGMTDAEIGVGGGNGRYALTTG